MRGDSDADPAAGLRRHLSKWESVDGRCGRVRAGRE